MILVVRSTHLQQKMNESNEMLPGFIFREEEQAPCVLPVLAEEQDPT